MLIVIIMSKECKTKATSIYCLHTNQTYKKNADFQNILFRNIYNVKIVCYDNSETATLKKEKVTIYH